VRVARPHRWPRRLTSLEICAGAGGQALGLERAGFRHVALVEIDRWACQTLRANRPRWKVLQRDLRVFSAARYRGVDLLAGGVPCPPFSVAGKKLGELDERDLFPEAIRLVAECRPRAVMLENVRGLLDPIFDDYRELLNERLRALGYVPQWRLLNASDYGVPQLRPRAVLVALRPRDANRFRWPEARREPALTVGEALRDEMSAAGWRGADAWVTAAAAIAPTLVGGSRKHGGPDLGPTRAKRAWATLGVDALVLGDAPPPADFDGSPRLTVRMTALLQGFPASWRITGGKTAAYRQVGNAFPPPVAEAVARSIATAIAPARGRTMLPHVLRERRRPQIPIRIRARIRTPRRLSTAA
jgi:DNA (cytosine-5)-methyltransferase 1